MQNLYKELHTDTQKTFVYSHALDPDAQEAEDLGDGAADMNAPSKKSLRRKNKKKRYAGVEGGGTTWVCAIAEGECDNIVERAEFPTTTPDETLTAVRRWLDAKAAERGPFDGLGVATFGPVDLDPASATYGYITHSPKPGWEKVNVIGALSDGEFTSIPI